MRETLKALFTYEVKTIKMNYKNSEVDNSQGNYSLAWAAGLFDGEGNVHASKAPNNKFTPVCQLKMCCEDTIKEFVFIMNSSGVGCHISSYNKTVLGRQTWQVHIGGLKRCLKFSELLLPYSVTKKPDLFYLKKWLTLRLQRDKTEPYTEEEYRLLGMLRNRKARVLTDYTLSQGKYL
jgi:hypothetical protein